MKESKRGRSVLGGVAFGAKAFVVLVFFNLIWDHNSRKMRRESDQESNIYSALFTSHAHVDTRFLLNKLNVPR